MIVTPARQNRLTSAANVAAENQAAVVISLVDQAKVNDDVVFQAHRFKLIVNPRQLINGVCNHWVQTIHKLACLRQRFTAAKQAWQHAQHFGSLLVAVTFKNIIKGGIILFLYRAKERVAFQFVHFQHIHQRLENANVADFQTVILAHINSVEHIASHLKNVHVGFCAAATDDFHAHLTQLMADAVQRAAGAVHSLIVAETQRHCFVFILRCHQSCHWNC